jgi:hypothetical protein
MPGKRFRLRPLEDVADEMAQLYHERKIEAFIFHDDNFFLPDCSRNLQRIRALSGMLKRRRVHFFSTIVKARPDDLKPEVVSALRQHLGLMRIYVGIENASETEINALGRGMAAEQNHRALELLESSDVFSCFNLLIFEPSTRIENLEANLAFMEKFAAVPQNFGRVELYAGTPLLARLQSEGLCSGDYLDTDYHIADSAVQRIFELTMQCFYVRNFSEDALPHRLMLARFSVEIAARFHPTVFQKSWRAETKRLCRALTRDSVKTMREIVEFVRRGAPVHDERNFVATLTGRLRATECLIRKEAELLMAKIETAIRQCALDGSAYSEPGGCHDGGRQITQTRG